MTDPSEQFPDGFDVGMLMPPSPETMQAFEGVIAGIKERTSSMQERAVGIDFGSESTGAITVWLSEIETHDAGRPKTDVLAHNHLHINGATGDGQTISITRDVGVGKEALPLAEEQVARLADVQASIQRVIGRAGISAGSMSWLMEACYEAQHTETGLLSLSIEELLTNAPVAADESTHFFLATTCEDGSEIDFQWTEADDSFFEHKPEVSNRAKIILYAPDGTRYIFKKPVHGETTLWVKKPGERVPIEATEQDAVAETTDGHTVRFRGNPEKIRAIAAGIIEEQQVKEQGLDKPTDGSICDFTSALRETGLVA